MVCVMIVGVAQIGMRGLLRPKRKQLAAEEIWIG
jgi:hypothetical protein